MNTEEQEKVERGEEHLRQAALDFPYQRIIEWAQERIDAQTPPDAQSVSFYPEGKSEDIDFRAAPESNAYPKDPTK